MSSHYADWRSIYESRQRTADQAMEEAVHDGSFVCISILTPGVLTQAFQRRAQQLGRVDFRTLAPRELDLFGESGPRGEKEIELFIGDSLRWAHDAQVATYLPNTFMMGMKAFDEGRPEARMPDVFLTPCSPPNEHGYVHFGPHMWQRKAYTRRCKTTIAAVDPNIQYVHGDVWVHVSEIAYFVEGAIRRVDIPAVRQRVETITPEAERPALLAILDKASPDQIALVEDTYHLMPASILGQALGLGEIDPAAQAIADNIRPLIRNGDTIQVGVGQPSSLMFKAGAFDDAEDLGLHTELGSPGLAKLWERGILNASKKTLHKHRNVAVAWTGCDGEDLNLIANNPVFELYDPDFLLNPAYMSQNRNMTSVNSAIAVDLLGQIASEDRFGGHMVNGTGGQPDTHMSAFICRGGRAITVMRSTAVEGSLSKVVAKHEAGTLITIPRYMADTIVTEHGVARLLDKNHRQRAAEMISVAHPDFRAELRQQAKELVGVLEFGVKPSA